MIGLFSALAFTLLLGSALLVTGWAIGELARIRALSGKRLEIWIARAFLGTGAWILIFGLWSHLGGSARLCRLPSALAWVAAVATAIWLRRPRLKSLRLPMGSSLVFAGSTLLSLALVFWPLRHCAAVWPFNDTLAYCSISQWLQDHGFGESIAIDPDIPATRYVNEFQVMRWRMGSTFLLALVQGYSGLDPLLAFPVVMGWGMLLNLGGIFLVVRWGLRLDRWIAAGASLCAASALNPLYTSIHQGFQPQIFGTAFLLAAMALLGRAQCRAFWTKGNAFLLAIVIAALVSVYSELTPILGLTVIGYAVLVLGRKKDRSAWLRFAGWTMLFAALLGNIEWRRAILALCAAVGANVGYPIAWSEMEYIGFATGQLSFQHRESQVRTRLFFTIGACGFLLVGIRYLVRDRRRMMPAIALLLFAGMALWFRFIAIDPRSGEVGQRWSLFKVAKWSFPLLLVVQFAGLAVLLRRWRLRPALCLLPVFVILAMSYAHHREYNQWAGHAMGDVTGSATPVDDWEKLRTELERRGVTAVYLEHPGRFRDVNVLLPCALYPRRFVNGWKGTELEEIRPADGGAFPAGTIVLRIGGCEGIQLPGNVRLIELNRSAHVPGVAAAGQESERVRNPTNR